MAAQLFVGWEGVLALGVIILLIGLGLVAARRRSGWIIALMGAIWLIGFGIYRVLDIAGIYGKVAAEASYVPNIVGTILFLAGVGAFIYIARRRR